MAPPKSKYGRRTIRYLNRPVRSSGLARRAPPTVATTPSSGRSNGTPLDAGNLLGRVLKPAADGAGVGWAGWHTLRHTAGTMLFRHGANAVQVQRFLGHHSPAFTLATYVHLLPEDAPDVAFLDVVLLSAPPSDPNHVDPAVRVGR